MESATVQPTATTGSAESGTSASGDGYTASRTTWISTLIFLGFVAGGLAWLKMRRRRS
jgi:hypothetical protein